ncbi:MAG TPA: ribonuclease HII [Candidatus Saccharimonadia bacterium]
MRPPDKPTKSTKPPTRLPKLPAKRLLIGIDEVGRGAWAGPVVAAAVILPPRLRLPAVRDSKLMTPLARTRANREIRQRALAIGLGWVSAAELDAHGLSWAVRQSGLRALEALLTSWERRHFAYPGIVILDGLHDYLRDTPYDSLAIIKADNLVSCVAAASVVAKVARDNYLQMLERRHPGYGFAEHKGYGTPDHQAALRVLGPCAQHRQSFAPLTAFGRRSTA